ncbi:TraV family lipoprotein [Desulfurobacterium sp. TC5-1]|uniref:TraV family lipoprotein n=1 Tax=Desulfurobacterium sp. TC5-1 TaxID=1158318 RepID=UPI0003B31C7D|nr:TraV family lipoprotein [Desulfurobacterium sp. TC5-1]
MKKAVLLAVLLLLASCGEKDYKLRTVCTACNETRPLKVSKDIVQIEKEVLTKPLVPVRLQDQEVRILVLPYVDDHGDFHQGEYIYTVIRNGKWIFSRENLKRKPENISYPLKERK